MKSVAKLAGRHKNKDIYVIGAGPSCNFLSRSFFNGKIVVGVNQTYKKFPCNYVVRKEHSDVVKTLKMAPKSFVIVSKLNYGSAKSKIAGITHNNLHIFNHLLNKGAINTASFGKPGFLVVSNSTITSAIHFAYVLGAANIILVGADHGTLDDKFVYDGYYEDIKQTPWKNWEQYVGWLKILSKDTESISAKIREKGVNVVSLNPFINFGLEGHIYKYG